MNFSNALSRFRLVAFVEGCSWIFLSLIAEPIKYFGNDKPMKISGMIHGILFIIFVVALINVWKERKWKFSRALVAFLWSFVPFGMFVFDRSLKREQLVSAQ